MSPQKFFYQFYKILYLSAVLQVFSTELEKVGGYSEFTDFCNTFALSRGKNIDDEESSTVGEFKVIVTLL